MQPSTSAQPLAARMRPRTLREFIGQDHILGVGRLLRRAIGQGYDYLPSLQRDPYLDVLRSRADFQELLTEVAARRKGN